MSKFLVSGWEEDGRYRVFVNHKAGKGGKVNWQAG